MFVSKISTFCEVSWKFKTIFAENLNDHLGNCLRNVERVIKGYFSIVKCII